MHMPALAILLTPRLIYWLWSQHLHEMIMAQLTTKLSEVQICKQPLILNNWVESMQHEQGLTAEQAKDVRSALGRAINTDHLIPKESIKMEGHKITCIEGVSIVEGKLYVNGSPFIPDNCGAILPGGISSVSKYYVEPTMSSSGTTTRR